MLFRSVVGIPNSFWPDFWRTWIWMNLIIGIPATVWFTVGGIRDIREVFKRLRTIKRHIDDDGWVRPQDKVVEEVPETVSDPSAAVK